MWNKLLGLNTLVIWPITGIFFVYSLGHVFFTGDWKLLGVSALLFVLSIVTQFLLGILS
jgi:hypothetical protein